MVLILDRPRHQELIAAVRKAGARIRLISDGDVAGVIATSRPDSGIDIYHGQRRRARRRAGGGGAALHRRQFQGRLMFRNDGERARARKMGVRDLDRVYEMDELAQGDVMFAATGVTDGTMLKGVRRHGKRVYTNSVVMRSRTGTVRLIEAEHYLPVKVDAVPRFPG